MLKFTNIRKLLLGKVFIFSAFHMGAFAHEVHQTKGDFTDEFRQIEQSLPSPNIYRNAAGEPGREYWQQQVDYRIDVSLDETKRSISAKQQVTYHNNSPYTLKYLWLQLDQNRFRHDSMAERSIEFGGIGRRGPSTRKASDEAPAGISLKELRRQQWFDDNVPGYQILNVNDANNKKLPYTVVGSQMRIDLHEPLKPGQKTVFNMRYDYNLLEENAVTARSGYEHFPDDARKGGNDIFLLAQWFPRLQAYSDYEAWHNKEFLGRGEFTLEFGNYEVNITVPADHIVSSTGVLQNPEQVLTKKQRERLKKAEKSERPVFIVTAKEALRNEKAGTDKVKTWTFKANNVRDFAWSSSRKFMWDAKGYPQSDPDTPLVMAMSFYPKEGGDLWKKYSTEAIVHTMKVYSRFSFDYPYPVAQSVNGPVGGMEYPMITFNGPRTTWQEDGSRTYTLAEKRFLIGVVIHEIGHIYFPMIVNSDERQWTWMDEGINSFLDGVAGREWDPDIPWGVEARDIVDYMKSDIQVPIMTQSDSVLKLGPNAYTKPAVALNILRELILGRELFDFAFKEYAQRWKFKRPTPADFFRTMEEASGVDLDWFWHGWFYTTDHVDIAIDKVHIMKLDNKDPDVFFDEERKEYKKEPTSLFVERNAKEGKTLWVDRNKDLHDFYDENDRFTVTNKERNVYQQLIADLEKWEKKALERAIKEDKNYYVVEFSNLGGLVMPILLEVTYEDNTQELMIMPAEIWRRSPKQLSKLIVTDKKIKSLLIDPKWETADVDVENNYYPRRFAPSRLDVFKKEKKTTPEHRDIMHDIKTKVVKPEKKVKKK